MWKSKTRDLASLAVKAFADLGICIRTHTTLGNLSLSFVGEKEDTVGFSAWQTPRAERVFLLESQASIVSIAPPCFKVRVMLY